MSKSRFSWSRNKQTGRHMGPETYTLRRAGISYAMIQKGPNGCFAYGLRDGPSFNTCSTPTSMKEAKADAFSRVRDALSVEGGE